MFVMYVNNDIYRETNRWLVTWKVINYKWKNYVYMKISLKKDVEKQFPRRILVSLIKILLAWHIFFLINERKFILTYFRVILKGENNRRSLSTSIFHPLFLFFSLSFPFRFIFSFLSHFLKATVTTSTWKNKKRSFYFYFASYQRIGKEWVSIFKYIFYHIYIYIQLSNSHQTPSVFS